MQLEGQNLFALSGTNFGEELIELLVNLERIESTDKCWEFLGEDQAHEFNCSFYFA